MSYVPHQRLPQSLQERRGPRAGPVSRAPAGRMWQSTGLTLAMMCKVCLSVTLQIHTQGGGKPTLVPELGSDSRNTAVRLTGGQCKVAWRHRSPDTRPQQHRVMEAGEAR